MHVLHVQNAQNVWGNFADSEREGLLSVEPALHWSERLQAECVMADVVAVGY